MASGNAIIHAVLNELKSTFYKRLAVCIFLSVCAAGWLLIGAAVATDKPVIGAVEHVILEPQGIKITARIDTGAATTSLDARNVKILEDKVTFNLSPKFGGAEVSMPIVGWKHIRTSGSRERRPIVEMDLCIDSKRLRVLVNLSDRSEMRYPLLLGRNVIIGNFVVDPSHSYLTKPSKDCGDQDK
jgi:hypothetical protein